MENQQWSHKNKKILIPTHVQKEKKIPSNWYRTNIFKHLSDIRPLIYRQNTFDRYCKQFVHCFWILLSPTYISVNTVHSSPFLIAEPDPISQIDSSWLAGDDVTSTSPGQQLHKNYSKRVHVGLERQDRFRGGGEFWGPVTEGP